MLARWPSLLDALPLRTERQHILVSNPGARQGLEPASVPSQAAGRLNASLRFPSILFSSANDRHRFVKRCAACGAAAECSAVTVRGNHQMFVLRAPRSA